MSEKKRSKTASAKAKTKVRPKKVKRKVVVKPKPSFIIKMKRAHKKFHEEIDRAMGRAYKCHPNCRGFEKCEWRMHLLHVLDLKQAIRDVTRVINRAYYGESKKRGKKPTPLITGLKKLTEQGYTVRRACEMSIPDFKAKEKAERDLRVRMYTAAIGKRTRRERKAKPEGNDGADK